jgi:hypothetical protein
MSALPSPDRLPERQIVEGGRYEGVEVAQLEYREPGGVLRGFEAIRCRFENVRLGTTEPEHEPVVVRNCRLEQCSIRSVTLWSVQVEDCLVDCMDGPMTYLTYGPLLKHVVVQGDVDALYVLHPGRFDADARLIVQRRAFYDATDWALDISRARFGDCELSGVPGRLVRRDPETQILVTRDRVTATPWQEVAAGEPHRFVIEGFLKSDMDSLVLVASSGVRRSLDLSYFARLREAGVAAPD